MKKHGFAFLSNSMTSAMESHGEIIWFPAPRFDSESLFSKILDDERGGHFSLRPVDWCTDNAAYIGNSLVLKSIFTTAKGALEVIDFLPPGLPAIIRMFKSDVPFIAEIKPRFNYGELTPIVTEHEDGISFRNTKSVESFDVRIFGKYKKISDDTLRFNGGEGYLLSMYAEDFRQGLFSNRGFVYPNPKESLATTLNYWESQLAEVMRVKSFKEAYYRSLAVVMGLTYAASGGIMAAATTSMPTMIGGNWNWDYRYVWTRDTSYAAAALAKVGAFSRARRTLNFLLSLIDLSSKSFDRPLYRVDGTAAPVEMQIPWLKGHLNSRPVRVGNTAWDQIQMDTEGEFVEALYTYYRMSGDIGYVRGAMWALDAIAEWCKGSWRKKSTSLWEERGEQQHFVYTKLMNWLALERISRLNMALGREDKAVELKKVGESIRRDILERGFSRKLNSFVKYYGSSEVDSSLLNILLCGFLGPEDKRVIGTIKLVRARLASKSGLLLRTENDYEGRDSRPFTLINTWLARAYIMMGDMDMAKKTLNGLLNYSTSLLLFSERADEVTKDPLGNFPQLFTHAGIIEAVAEYEDPSLCQKV